MSKEREKNLRKIASVIIKKEIEDNSIQPKPYSSILNVKMNHEKKVEEGERILKRRAMRI